VATADDTDGGEEDEGAEEVATVVEPFVAVDVDAPVNEGDVPALVTAAAIMLLKLVWPVAAVWCAMAPSPQPAKPLASEGVLAPQLYDV